MTTGPRIAELAAALHENRVNCWTDRDDVCVAEHAKAAAAILAAAWLPGWMLVRSEAGTRLIRVDYDLEQFGARTADGRLQTAEWREPLDDGTYEPLFTATDDGMTLLTAAELARLRKIEEAARAACEWESEHNEYDDYVDLDALRAALEATP